VVPERRNGQGIHPALYELTKGGGQTVRCLGSPWSGVFHGKRPTLNRHQAVSNSLRQFLTIFLRKQVATGEQRSQIEAMVNRCCKL